MTTATTFLLGEPKTASSFRPMHPRLLHSEMEVRRALPGSKGADLWIATKSGWAEVLLKCIAWPIHRKLGSLIVLESIRCSMELPLAHAFSHVVVSCDKVTLPWDQLADALLAENRADLMIAGTLDKKTGMLTLWRGDLSSLVVPSAMFTGGHGTKPDFDHFALDDYGNTVRFGEYEAAADAILYECDLEYRRRINAARRESERGFGPSLRRLRLQKGVGREEFTGLSEKTIARLERGESGRPRGRTLGVIARRLGVSPEEIETF